MTDTLDSRLARRVGVVTLVVALLPFLLPIALEERTIVNGELTDYSYVNVTAIVAGLAALGYTYRTVASLRFRSAMNRTFTALFAVLVVVALFQLVRGSGVIPAVTECSASYSLDLCRPEIDRS
ncbi:hypothetical protein ABT354_33755 [Streptomyces sp. NPDC000594]|uniref:hypothetical protein n=1 Tax=Streptomyces sp. NPDC000594 TaxID=3154261 RepID=UPI0033196046